VLEPAFKSEQKTSGRYSMSAVPKNKTSCPTSLWGNDGLGLHISIYKVRTSSLPSLLLYSVEWVELVFVKKRVLKETYVLELATVSPKYTADIACSSPGHPVYHDDNGAKTPRMKSVRPLGSKILDLKESAHVCMCCSPLLPLEVQMANCICSVSTPMAET
jgi:hypothetical protein